MKKYKLTKEKKEMKDNTPTQKEWREEMRSLVVGAGTRDGVVPPVTMGELLMQSQNANLKPFEDFIEALLDKTRKEVARDCIIKVNNVGIALDFESNSILKQAQGMITTEIEEKYLKG